MRSSRPDFHELLRLVEDFPRPIVMAVNGTALGAAWSSPWRATIASAAPPRGSGCPKSISASFLVRRARNACSSGRSGEGARDVRFGEADRCQGRRPLRSSGPRHRGRLPRRRRWHSRAGWRDASHLTLARATRTDKLGDPTALDRLLAAARDKARKTRRHQTAPLAAVDAIAAAATLPFDEGCRRERALSLECVRSEQARAMVHAFFAERDAARGVATSSGTGAIEIHEVAVVGAGTMGTGIAMTCANAGLRVSIADTAPEAVEHGLATIRRNYQSSVERGRLTAGDVAERLARIRGVVGYDGIASADLVIEAVFESLALKKEVFAEIARRARPGTVLASNTSTLDVDQLAAAAGRAESVVGLHFFSPAQVMRLVEIVRGRRPPSRSFWPPSSSRNASPKWASWFATGRVSWATA